LRALRNLSSTLLYDRGEEISDKKHVPYSGTLTFYTHGHMVMKYEIESKHGISSYWQQRKFIEKMGFLERSALKSGLKPFWERGKPKKGWNTAPLDIRLKRMADQVEGLDLALPTDDQWALVIEAPPQSYVPVGEYFDPKERFYGKPINPMQKSKGLSLAWRIPNKVWFRKNCSAEQIKLLESKTSPEPKGSIEAKPMIPDGTSYAEYRRTPDGQGIFLRPDREMYDSITEASLGLEPKNQ